MAKSGPGKAHREGISLIELGDMFPDEGTATAWFESHVWPNGRHCPRCGCVETSETPGNMPYWCSGCRRRFSVRVGTAMERSKVPLRKWAVAIYLEMTSLNSPLKKASLTGFHATAKHIAAKAVSPSSETMRTI